MVNESQRAPARIVLGLIVVAIGVLFLLDNLGVFGFAHAISFWPLGLMAGGAALIAGERKESSRKTGTILIIVGAVLMLQRLGLFDVSWRIAWPLVMIAMGVMILYHTMGPRRVHDRLDRDGASADSVIDVTAILGGVEKRVATPDFRGGDITAMLGGCDLDLRDCSIVKEASLDVFAFWGGITVRVPADWTVVLDGRPLMGGFTQKTVTPPDGSKRLVISGTAVMGGVEVKN